MVNESPALPEISPGVLQAVGERVDITANAVDDLVARACETRRTHRILLHPDVEDPVQEMLIVHPRIYIRPQKLGATSKSYHVVRGELELVMYDDDGTVIEHRRMRPLAQGGPAFIRIMAECTHSVVTVSDAVAFFEALPGPFKGTVYADWAPPTDGGEAAGVFFAKLLAEIGLSREIGR